jgi:diacylglycerol kinase (ATP)
MKFSMQSRLKSFRYAFTGIWLFISSQHNAWIQILVSILVIFAGIFFSISVTEWCLVLLCIGLVLSLEAVNTSIEHLADTLHPGIHEGIRKVKDIAAGAVLISAIIAVVIGSLVFLPHLLNLFHSWN